MFLVGFVLYEYGCGGLCREYMFFFCTFYEKKNARFERVVLFIVLVVLLPGSSPCRFFLHRVGNVHVMPFGDPFRQKDARVECGGGCGGGDGGSGGGGGRPWITTIITTTTTRTRTFKRTVFGFQDELGTDRRRRGVGRFLDGSVVDDTIIARADQYPTDI